MIKWIKQLFCNHEWKKESDTILPPMIDLKLVENIKGIFPNMLARTHIAIFSCSRCGKLKKYVTKQE